MSNDDLASRLDFVDLRSDQRVRLVAARHRVARLVGPALERFYGIVSRTPAVSAFFRDGAHMNRAKSAQMRHWERLMDGEFDADYHASVRRIGERHALIGLEPRWYIGAYSLVLEELLRGLGRGWRAWFAPRRVRETQIALVKAALIDMELSVSVYFERTEAAQKQVVGVLEERLARLAKGDMTVAIAEPFEAGYEPVRTNFNTAIASLRDLIGGVTHGTVQIRSGVGEIANASEDLARRTEANAANLEQTTAAVTEIDARIQTAAAGAQKTVERANLAMATVEEGRGIADEAVRAMTRVAESAQGIDDVIEGLDKIAFQTRVLAMNAAVEAGRAGEAGRGFAVVADLVSALAMRAEEEAGRARDQLTSTQSDIVSAVGMVQRVGGAFGGISENVADVNRLLGELAVDNQVQSTALSEIAAAIGAMDRATQQNAAMVEQTSAAARTLTGEVTILADRAAQFVVGGRGATTLH